MSSSKLKPSRTGNVSFARNILSTVPNPRPQLVKRKINVPRKQRPRESSTRKVHKYPAGTPKMWTNAVTRPDCGILFRPQWVGTISGASTNVYKKFNPNSIYAPEVSGTPGQTPGYADWAAFYGFYRVIEYSYKISIMNKEAFDISVWVNNSNNDPGASANSTIASNDKTQLKTVSAKGGLDKVTFTGHYTIAQIIGSDAVYTADTYRSLIGSSPADVTWLTVGIQSFGGNLTNGADMEISLSQKTIMYDYLTQAPSPLELETIKAHQKVCHTLQRSQTPVKYEPAAEPFILLR